MTKYILVLCRVLLVCNYDVLSLLYHDPSYIVRNGIVSSRVSVCVSFYLRDNFDNFAGISFIFGRIMQNKFLLFKLRNIC